MEDDYNFEDFDYEPEEIVENKKEVKNVIENNNSNKTIVKTQINPNLPTSFNKNDLYTKNTLKNKHTVKNEDEYGGFEDDINPVDNINDIQEIEDIKSSTRRHLNINENKNNQKINLILNKKETADNNDYKVNNYNNNFNYNYEESKRENTNSNLIINKGHISHEYHSDKNNSNNFKQSHPNLEELNSISVILPHSNSRLQTHVNAENSIFHSKLADVKGNNGHVVSRMQIAEKNYSELKSDLEKFFQNSNRINLNDNNDNKNKIVDQISKENLELIKYLEKMSQIINIVIDSSKIPIKNPNFTRKPLIKKNAQTNANNAINNNKLLDVYKKEYLKLELRLKQISDPNYEEILDETLIEFNNQIINLEQENKKLKNSQKQSEVLFERQYKNNIISNAELSKINMEYDNVKKLNEMTLEKVQRGKSQINDNENRTNELNEWHSKLDTIAREMYGIKDYDNFKEEELSEKKILSKKQNLRKKMEILEKVMISNKKKFESEITRNERTIVSLERNKIEMMKVLKDKTILAYKSQEKVKGIYNKYDESTLLSPEILGDNLSNHDIQVLTKIINGNNLNNENLNLLTDDDKEVMNEENEIILNGRVRKNKQNSSSQISMEERNSDLIINKENEIILDKKNIDDVLILNENKIIKDDNKNENLPINNVNTRLFKPNIKFNNDIEEVKLIYNNPKVNDNVSTNIRNVQVILDKDNSEKEKNINLNSDIAEIISDEKQNISVLNNSRRKINNNVNVSINNKEKSLFPEKEKYNPVIIKEEAITNNNKINSNVPLFLQDFHKKNDDHNNSILNYSNLNNNTNNIGNSRRLKEKENSDKEINNKINKGILFDDVIKEDLNNNENNSNNLHRRIKLTDSIDFTNFNEEKVVDQKKKLDFDNLFKDDDITTKNVIKNNENSNNLLFKNNVSTTGRNRENLLNNFNNNINFNNNNINLSSNNKTEIKKEKPKDLFDELEEIVL